MSGAVAPLLLFVLAFGAVGVFALRNRLLGTLALREAIRRRGQTLLVVGGLMVGTATITASLVAADSVGDSTVDAFAYRNWGRIDITVTANNRFFGSSVATAIASDPAVRAATDGVAGGVEFPASVADLTRKQSASRVVVVGFDPSLQKPFGAFTLTNGRSTYGVDLGTRGVIVSRTLADKLDARTGDTLTIQGEVGDPSIPADAYRGAHRKQFTIAGIARSEGPGAYTLGSVVFSPTDSLREWLGFGDAINVVRVSAPGGIRDSGPAAVRALPVVRAAAARAGSAVPLTVRNAKAAEAAQAKKGTTFIRSMLIGMSAIVVAAGAALMVNITGMLAEERRTRLGVLRALGLRRRRVVGLSVIEGGLYSFAAGVTGAGVGVGAGRLVAGRFGKAFAEFAGGNFDFHFFFSLKPATVLTGFAVGSVLTLGVIFFASRRTSRMTITAAIRNLPEPPRSRAQHAWPGRVRLSLGTVLGIGGVLTPKPFPRLAGGVALILVAASLLRRRLSQRVHASLLGFALAGVSFGVVATQRPGNDPGAFFAVFVTALVTSVFGLTILATANLHMVETGVTLLGRAFTGLRAVLRPPLAFLSRRPVRTGLSTGVFALVIAMLSMFAVFLVIFKPTYEKFGNGYDIRVASTGSPNVSVPASLAGEVRRSLKIPARGYVGPFRSEGGFTNSEKVFVPIYEAPANAPSSSPVRLDQRDKKYSSDAAAWEAVLRDPGLVVANFANSGSKITLAGSDGKPVTFKIAAVQSFLLQGIFANPAAMARFDNAPAGAVMLVDIRDPSRARSVARSIEAALFASGADAEPVRDIYDQANRANRAFFSTIGILMRMGLIVGILSLGIVALRVVTERRHVIGVMRAIGYRRRQVMAGLMTEAAATATIGVAVGGFVGVMMGWIFWHQQENRGPFGIEWASIGGILAIVYVAVVLVTLGPAWRASRLPPAEAVRYSE